MRINERPDSRLLIMEIFVHSLVALNDERQ